MIIGSTVQTVILVIMTCTTNWDEQVNKIVMIHYCFLNLYSYSHLGKLVRSTYDSSSSADFPSSQANQSAAHLISHNDYSSL